MTLLCIKQAAKYLGIKESRIKSAVFRKEIPHIKIGRLVRFKTKDLDEFITNNTVKKDYKNE